MKYKAIESVYAATVKYVGTVFALIASDCDPDLHFDSWNKIFRSSSLGGWLQAAELVCANSKTLPEPVREYCADYSTYRTHPSRTDLDRIKQHLSAVVDELHRSGYRIEIPKSLSILRVLACSITIRNKCAHGALDSLFFSRIESDYAKALKIVLQLIPFASFTLWGAYGRNSLELVESPRHLDRLPNTRFWIESELLSRGQARDFPFLIYREDSKSVYCLNEDVDIDNPVAEYIDYGSGSVVSREVSLSLPSRPIMLPRHLRPRDYAEHGRTLRRAFKWRNIPLTKASIDTCTDDSGIYLFTTAMELGERAIDVILYVGKTTNLRSRLRSYLRIQGGYDDSRPEISYMFATYKKKLTLMFTPVPVPQLGRVERAIYETTMPEYNIISPPRS
ncbi:MAG: GIY-YIG nuclease family protein [Spirochaetaceae bacterium]|nr:GIY-YIG nuclease family protein [Spirochaetaceae bacterium]